MGRNSNLVARRGSLRILAHPLLLRHERSHLHRRAFAGIDATPRLTARRNSALRKDFLLGPWLASARNCGITPAEKNDYERNARDLITLWGDANSPLHEYANRQWSGLLNDFYKVRWQKFFALLHQSLQKDMAPDLDQFQKEIRAWEWHWVNEHRSYPTTPAGDSRKIGLGKVERNLPFTFQTR